MPYASFHYHFREIAEKETRTVTIMREDDIIPKGDYGLIEMYCDDPDCDCRRVFLYVISSLRDDVEAVIAYGWESAAFYARWLGDDDPRALDELRGPVLNLGSPQSRLAPAILELVKNVVLQDHAYVERLKTHYRLFRDGIDGRHAPTAKKTERRSKGSSA